MQRTVTTLDTSEPLKSPDYPKRLLSALNHAHEHQQLYSSFAFSFVGEQDGLYNAIDVNPAMRTSLAARRFFGQTHNSDQEDHETKEDKPGSITNTRYSLQRRT